MLETAATVKDKYTIGERKKGGKEGRKEERQTNTQTNKQTSNNL